MARYKTIDIRIWMDEKFLSLDEGTQLLFLYLLTSQHTTPIGTLSLPCHVIAAWLQKDVDTVSKRLQILSQKGLIKVSNLGLIWIRNYLKYNPPANPKVAVGYCKFFEEMPECDLQGEVAEAVISSCKSKGSEYLNGVEDKLSHYVSRFKKSSPIETVSELYRNQEQEQEIYIPSKDGIVETAVSDAPSSESEKVGIPKTGIDCPYQKIVSDYNTILGPYLGMCQKLTPTRQKAVRARWLDCMKDGDFKTQEEGVAYFKRYFDYIRSCDFLMGGNGRDWRADFDWIFKQQNYTKICEGKYLSR